jgi:hypothetical protein
MSSGARPVSHRVRRLYRRVVWLFIGLTAAAGIVLGVVVGIDRAFSSTRQSWPRSWPPKPCVVRGIDARCGTFTVPENRAKPTGRTIGLRVVVLPAALKPVRKDAVTYLAGGPGDAATEQAVDQGWQSSALKLKRDILLVDQRGAGARLRGRRRPTGSRRQPLRPRAALPRQPHRDLPAHRAPVGDWRMRRPDRHGLRRTRHHKGPGHHTLLRRSRGATVPAYRLRQAAELRAPGLGGVSSRCRRRAMGVVLGVSRVAGRQAGYRGRRGRCRRGAGRSGSRCGRRRSPVRVGWRS